MDIQIVINKLRKISFFLFIIPAIGLIFSLLFQNLLTITKFDSGGLILDEKNSSLQIECNKNNNYCINYLYPNFKNIKKKSKEIEKPNKINLNNCNVYYTEMSFSSGTTSLSRLDFLNNYFLTSSGKPAFKIGNLTDKVSTPIFNYELFEKKISSETIFLNYNQSNKKNQFCIKNNKIYKYHKLFPFILNYVQSFKLSPKYISGVDGLINPFLYGETSISNIVKRFPINYLFKPLLFLTSFVMLFYWLKYNRLLNILSNDNKNYLFVYFGIASSFFLFFHVYFLGTEIGNEIFTKIRKIVLLFFIIFELLAQMILTRKLYLMRGKLENYISNFVLNLKILYTCIIGLITLIIIVILSNSGFTSKMDYILEWNYFVFLLFFYLLSSIIWKKIS